MNVQSAPKSDKFYADQEPVAITPVKGNSEDSSKRLKNETNRSCRSETDSDNELVMKSQRFKNNKRRKRKSRAKNHSKDIFVDENLDSKNGINLPEDLNLSLNNSDLQNDFNSFAVTDPDTTNWTDKSLLPKESKLELSSQIRKKLIDNLNKVETLKSQSTGWTQFEFSDPESFQLCEVGTFFGLPLKVQKMYEELKGVKELYSWQEDCLNLDAVKLKKNLVYSLPTSGGKTLVAEILILKEMLCCNKNVLFILPFVSIVQEKIKDLSQFAVELGFLVEEYAAGKGVIPPKKRRRKRSLFIATIEKASVVINSLIEMGRLDELGLIVVDELHLLAEEGRGAVLETLLTQILYLGGKIQVIGMTATIGNLEEVAEFLKADTFTGDFRPTCLKEYIKCENKIYGVDLKSEHVMKEIRTLSTLDAGLDGISELVLEVVPDDSVLIFCATKKNCENVALLLCQSLSRHLVKFKESEKYSLYRALLTETNDQICPTLSKTIPYGVAYHHSGLTSGERKLLEESFRDGTLSIICCTSTLAAGVNLPAKRVIIRSPYVGKDFITLSKYKQMVGRAGRTGFKSEGESFLICQPRDFEKVGKLFLSQMDEVVSKMNAESFKNLVLTAIGLGIATTRRMLRELLSFSLLHLQAKRLNKSTDKIADSCISDLFKQGALKIKNLELSNPGENSKMQFNTTQGKKCLKLINDSQLIVSRLGRAAMKGGLSLEKAHDLYGELVKAQASLVLLTGLHLLYLVTPYDLMAQIKPDFSLLFNVYMQLESKEVHTAKIIGITEFVISKLAIGIKPKNVPETVINRFYISLILNELWKEQTVWNVAALFQLPRGLVQTVMTSSATFANSILRFCEQLEELWSFKSLLMEFAPRLAHCCAPELLPLMDLPAVKRGRAKQLYDAGFKNLHTLAASTPGDLVRSVDHLSYKVASQIVAAAKLLLIEKAENLKDEAEDVLEGLSEKSAPIQS